MDSAKRCAYAGLLFDPIDASIKVANSKKNVIKPGPHGVGGFQQSGLREEICDEQPLHRKLVSLPVHGEDEFGLLRVVLEFLPQPRDVNIHRPSRGRGGISPNILQEILAR